MTEYENEPIPGLPGIPPPGEYILWHGAPDWRVLARTAFHTRLIAGYFALLAGVATLFAMRGSGNSTGVVLTAGTGLIGVVLLHLLAWASARTTIYTLTNRRIVLRIGIAVPKCINLPLTQIASADLALNADGSGDMPLTLAGSPKLGFIALWPHARPWRLARPVPMLRCVPDGEQVAKLIARACARANPAGLPVALAPADRSAPVLQGVAA